MRNRAGDSDAAGYAHRALAAPVSVSMKQAG